MTRQMLVALFLSGAMVPPAAPAQQSSEQAERVSGSYRVSGSPAIRPSLIWDDGLKTFLNWPENIEAPAIFAIDAAGNETLVNSHYRDGRFVIDAVHSRLLFRLDRLTARAVRKADHS